jgi:hypothetical protein
MYLQGIMDSEISYAADQYIGAIYGGDSGTVEAKRLFDLRNEYLAAFGPDGWFALRTSVLGQFDDIARRHLETVME